MDWSAWAVFGLVATVLLTAVLIGFQLAGLTRLDIPLLLGTLVTGDPDRARFYGFFLHLAMGQLFALFYAAAFLQLETSGWWLGALFGVVHALVAGTLLVPLLPTSIPGSPPKGPVPAPPPPWNHPGSWPSTMGGALRWWRWWPMPGTEQCWG